MRRVQAVTATVGITNGCRGTSLMSENSQILRLGDAIFRSVKATVQAKNEDAHYEALRARDPRFDGKFFVGVRTTGVYCRPICPAKPKRENVLFFSSQLEAERAGFRPCLRCRPESAPRSPAWIGKSAVVRRAVKMLAAQEVIDLDEDAFAARFGVTARHLRRLFVEEIGKTPKQISFMNRLNLARKLITETRLSVTEAAAASGFGSIRRFNDAFKDRFKRSPREIRRGPLARENGLTLSLSYRPPYDFETLLAHYHAHRVGDLQWVENDVMHRVISFGGTSGQIAIANDSDRSRLLVEIDFPDSSKLHLIVARVREMFDLDSDPVVVANALEREGKFKAMLKRRGGIRLPSGWDTFEAAIAVILGQLVSVEAGRRLVSELVELLGQESGVIVNGKNVKLFPSPETIAAADLSTLKTTAARKKTLRTFSRAVADGSLSLEPAQDVETFSKKALAIAGVGPWTASYLALKCLRHTDAFPETDLILGRRSRK
jgi:AraC family transcriptional regulator, regulatory protein of adaptative response / DNA-3-methyladenine glycosylase II